MGKLTINGQLSIAMCVYQRVTTIHQPFNISLPSPAPLRSAWGYPGQRKISRKWRLELGGSNFASSSLKYHWIGLRENLNRKPWILPSNIYIGLPCKFSRHPILWKYGSEVQRLWLWYIYTHPNSTEVGLKVFSEQVTTSTQLENQTTSYPKQSEGTWIHRSSLGVSENRWTW